MRTRLSIIALGLAIAVLAIRIRDVNKPRPVELAPRTLHLLYLDSLRRELVTFAEQYGRPVFQYDTVSPVTGQGRIQLARLHQALFDPRVEYSFGDEGFSLDWRTDPKPRPRQMYFRTWGAPGAEPVVPIMNAWPQPAAEYARIRRFVITPRWPDPPLRRTNRRRPSAVPPHGSDAHSAILIAASTTHYPLPTTH